MIEMFFDIVLAALLLAAAIKAAMFLIRTVTETRDYLNDKTEGR